MKRLVFSSLIISIFFSFNCYCKTFVIAAPFLYHDLNKINAYSMIGKFDNDSSWGIFHKITGDFEVGYLISIEDTEDVNIKKCTFVYEEDYYKLDTNFNEIDSWVESLGTSQDVIHSLISDNKIIGIYDENIISNYQKNTQ